MSEHRDGVIPRRFGLLVVDLVAAVTDGGGVTATAGLIDELEGRVIPHVVELANAMRARCEPVVWSKPLIGAAGMGRRRWGATVPHIAGSCLPGTASWEALAGLTVVDSDYEVPKHSCSSLWGGNADAVLRNRGITDVLVAGCLTNHGVLIDATDASHRGYRVTIVADACAALTAAAHEAALNANKQYTVANTSDVLAVLRTSGMTAGEAAR